MSALTMRLMARLWALWARAAWNAASWASPVRPLATSLACSSRMRSISAISSGVARRAASAAIGGLEQPAGLEELADALAVGQDHQGQRLDRAPRARCSRTNAPSPARISTSPRLSSARSASRTDVRLTMNFSASSRSGGSRSPDLSLPLGDQQP